MSLLMVDDHYESGSIELRTDDSEQVHLTFRILGSARRVDMLIDAEDVEVLRRSLIERV